MASPLSSRDRTLLEKAATDNGWDLELPRESEWLGFASTQVPLRIWLTTFQDAVYLAAFSQLQVARALGEYGTPLTSPLPEGAAAGRSVTAYESLRPLLRRAFQLSKSLPDEPLRAFEKQIAGLPRTTEAECVVVQRVGQNILREALLAFWEGRCALTGLAVPELLRASHIKPWAVSTDAERLDVFNALLLAPHLDAAFDKGFITVEDGGAVVVSAALDAQSRRLIGLEGALRVTSLHERHRQYLAWHRAELFRLGSRGDLDG